MVLLVKLFQFSFVVAVVAVVGVVVVTCVDCVREMGVPEARGPRARAVCVDTTFVRLDIGVATLR